MKILTTSTLAALATLCSLTAHAQTADPAYAKARAQVDGITNKVLDNLWVETDEYWHHGDYNRIVDLCRVIMEGDPNDEEVCSSAAYLLWSMGDTPASDWLLNYGIKRATKNQGMFYWNTGFHIFNTKRYKDALPYLEKGVKLGNVPYPAYATLGHCYDRVNLLPQSIKAWEDAVKRFPNMGSAKVNLARVKAKLAKQK